eukprot:GCRY01006569.1.p1 GENE.GCRY01006569.1~~GCRY01006569.1.p1  ORF type:complete len:196 (+),score=16.30 GCRY01006569.1:70-588(+)
MDITVPLWVVFSAVVCLFFVHYFQRNEHYLVIRLLPGQDVKRTLLEYCQKCSCEGAIVSAVGSLKRLHLRLADARPGVSPVLEREEKFEICSLSGTVCPNQEGAMACHLHMTAADGDGNCVGGHVMDSCIVNTTLELVLVNLKQQGLKMRRILDPNTGYEELTLLKGKSAVF